MFLKDEKGGSLIEFAIIAPLLFVILFGIVEFGLLLYNQAVITNASREGARYGIVAASTRMTLDQIRDDAVLPACTNLISFGTSELADVNVSSPDGTAFGDNLEVQVSWEYTFLVLPNLTRIGFNNSGINLSARTVMKYE